MFIFLLQTTLMKIKKKNQHLKKSEQINEIITQLQAHIRGYLVRQKIKNKIQVHNKQEIYALKIQVSCLLIFNVLILY